MSTTALARVSELDRYVAEVSRYPLLSAEEELELAFAWRDHGDVEAAHRLVTSNLRFVVKIANEYRGYGARTLRMRRSSLRGRPPGARSRARKRPVRSVPCPTATTGPRWAPASMSLSTRGTRPAAGAPTPPA